MKEITLKEIIITILLLAVGIIATGILIHSGSSYFPISDNNFECCYDSMRISDFQSNLDIIENNCGSTHLVHKSPISKEYYVFKEICNKDEYCKYEYLELKNCLK